MVQTRGVQDIVNKHLENVSSTIDSEIYQMIKSLGFKGEIHELEEIQNWLDNSGYTIQLNSMNHSGMNINQYSIKEGERILRDFLVKQFYEDGKLKLQISKEGGRNGKI